MKATFCRLAVVLSLCPGEAWTIPNHNKMAFPITSSLSPSKQHLMKSIITASATTCHAVPVQTEQEHSEISGNGGGSITQEWDANRYRNQHSFVFEFGSSLIDVLDPQPGERILDLGCGTGELTQAIAQRAGSNTHKNVIGMDADFNMVAAAQSSFPNVTFVHADASSFTLEEPVDAIFSNAALHWVTNAEQAVICMSRALSPGGRLVVEFGGKGNVKRIVQAAHDVLGTNNHDEVWYFPSIGEYCSLLEKHGLEVTSAVLYDRPTVLQGADGMKNWYRMFGSALLQGTREEDMEGVLDALEEKLKPLLFDGEKWTADYRRIRIVARKSEDF